MIYPVSFAAEHLKDFPFQAAQAWSTHVLAGCDLRALESKYAFTLMEDGQPLACCGAVPLSAGHHRAIVWSFFSDRATARKFVSVFRQARLFIDDLPFTRLEAVAEADFCAGHRFLQRLGFSLETPVMKRYFENGADGAGYVLVRDK